MKLFRCVPLLVAPLLLGACASSGGIGDSANERITVTVRNDLRPATPVTIRVVSDGGARHLLGSVPPQTTRNLALEIAAAAGTYHLEAQVADGQELRSASFALFPFARVNWSLFNNSVAVDAP